MIRQRYRKQASIIQEFNEGPIEGILSKDESGFTFVVKGPTNIGTVYFGKNTKLTSLASNFEHFINEYADNFVKLSLYVNRIGAYAMSGMLHGRSPIYEVIADIKPTVDLGIQLIRIFEKLSVQLHQYA